MANDSVSGQPNDPRSRDLRDEVRVRQAREVMALSVRRGRR